MIYLHSHHKCASRWASKYFNTVAETNYLTFFHDDKTENVRKTSAHINFFGNSDYRRAVGEELWGIHFVRNPLNIIVSSYFSHLKTHPETGWSELTKQRRLLRSVDFEEGLYLTLMFLERADIGAGTSGPLYAMRNWDYDDTRFKTVRIEDFTLQPSRWATDAIPLSRPHLPPDWRFSFEAFSGGRPRGSVDDTSHYRSGDPEEWRKHVPAAMLRYVQTYFAGLLSRHYPELIAADATERGPVVTRVAGANAYNPAGRNPVEVPGQPANNLQAASCMPESKKAQQNRARG